MVAIIDAGNISSLLSNRRNDKTKAGTWSTSWRNREWRTAKPQVALLLNTDGWIQWLGRAEPSRTVSDRDTLIEVSEIEEIETTLYATLASEAKLTAAEARTLGPISVDAGDKLIDTLTSFFPHLEDLVEWLGRDNIRISPNDDHAIRVNEQRDATGLLLDISGVGRRELRQGRFNPFEQLPSFLASQLPRAVSEETLIDHDVNVVPGMEAMRGAHVDWRIFQNANNRLYVANTNMEPLERTLGVDVIYYNQGDNSFVMVQYKRMINKRATGTKELWYRPDDQLYLELDRMRGVDELCIPAPDSDFRLHSQASWVKLCDPTAEVDKPHELIQGMYLPRAYFEALLDSPDCRGPRGRPRLGYSNVKRHLSNTSFIDLVKSGWIGSHGASSSNLEAIIRQVLTDRRALVLGVKLDQRLRA
ncbi:hypothetical protein [Pseudonocardia xishanensis]|uniref:Uncharacterized protein n=1 Tax=Pseudonocardia xishanensis TaxID=630995 RepID=A0ABP8RXB9_9PSEU